MIFLYSGTPGSGKSLHMAMCIYHQLRAGVPVITNFDINPDFVSSSRGGAWYRYLDNLDLKPEALVEYARDYWSRSGERFKEGRIKLYIDECQILFNARSWDMKGRAEWIKFFTQHRKYGYDVILVAQFDRMIDRQLRSLIEYECIHRKFSNFGVWGKVVSLALGGNAFVSVKTWYPLKQKVGSEIIRVRKKYYSLYDSYRTFEEEGSPSVSVLPSKSLPENSPA